jgi:hypothetical protein
MTHIRDQMRFCFDLTHKLKEAVTLHEMCRRADDRAAHADLSYYQSGIKEAGASKTQIQASIVQLRRELNILSRMFED